MRPSIGTLALLLSCSTTPVEPRSTPRLPDDTASCADACSRLRQLGCVESQPLEDGTSCEKFCEDTQNSGHALGPSCVSKIGSCAEVDSCLVLAH